MSLESRIAELEATVLLLVEVAERGKEATQGLALHARSMSDLVKIQAKINDALENRVDALENRSSAHRFGGPMSSN